MAQKTVSITTEFIKLEALLKLANLVGTGGAEERGVSRWRRSRFTRSSSSSRTC